MALQRTKYFTVSYVQVFYFSGSLSILEHINKRAMTDWWASIDWFERVYWIIAVPFSVVFLFQLILSFAGADGIGDADFDGDLGGDLADSDSIDDGGGTGFQIFTIRNFVTFLTIFGWSGITFIHNNASPLVTTIGSFSLGLVAMFMVAGLFYFFGRMVESGTMDLKHAIGTTGEVYLPIKAKRANMGRVQVNIQGSLREMSALTDEEEDLKTGTVIKVVEIINDNILLVKKG